MQYGICNLAVTPLRASASDESEIVSQLVFGDFIEILEDGRPWIRVRNQFDGYEGWMDFKQVVYISEAEYEAGITIQHPVVNTKTCELEGPFGLLTIFLGAGLPYLENGKCRLGDQIYELKQALPPISTKDVVKLSKYYLNAPYLWGGKSMYGIDCSGLVQNVYKAVGIGLPRDASQQVSGGKTINWSGRQVGDLIFYTTSSDKVTHVGILVSRDEIIHAHGRVRIDHVDSKGIYNDEQDKYTHKHHSIKRFI